MTCHTHPNIWIATPTNDCEAMKGELFQRLLAGNGCQEQSALEASEKAYKRRDLRGF